MSDYTTRKEKELNFLNNYVKPDTVLNKSDIVTKIKSSEFLNKNIPLSNMSDEKFCFGKNTLDYTYLRFKHNYTIYNEEKLIGLQYNNEWYYKTIYFNSGMSAITALVESLFEMQKIKIKYSDQIYFETYKILQAKNRIKKKYFFAFHDVIEPDFKIENINKDIIDKKCLGIIIDTTCLTETLLEDLVQSCINHNKLVFLVKSFTKLEMLATEYSRIGSLTLIASKQLDKQLTSVYKDLYVGIMQKNINYSCCPSPIDFPPFWDEDEFFNLNALRISKIKTNNSLVYESLKNAQKFAVVKPNHKLFLLIYPKNNFSRERLIEICKDVAARLSKKFNVKYCGSFGFDFIALDTYVNISDNKETIRLSLNDYDEKVVENFAVEFLEAINDSF